MTVTKLLPFNSQSPRGNCCRARLLLHSSIGLSLLLLLTANSSYSANAVGASCQATDPTSVGVSLTSTSGAAPGITKSPLPTHRDIFANKQALSVSKGTVGIGVVLFLLFSLLPLALTLAAIRQLRIIFGDKYDAARHLIYFIMSGFMVLLQKVAGTVSKSHVWFVFIINVSMFYLTECAIGKRIGIRNADSRQRDWLFEPPSVGSVRILPPPSAKQDKLPKHFGTVRVLFHKKFSGEVWDHEDLLMNLMRHTQVTVPKYKGNKSKVTVTEANEQTWNKFYESHSSDDRMQIFIKEQSNGETAVFGYVGRVKADSHPQWTSPLISVAPYPLLHRTFEDPPSELIEDFGKNQW
eukprot:GHVQ01007534.1.p1 GENE.GHVQ01007534.1~~GHVQ01007534.1.p1  ORF type:complete len:352 (+),score=44.88 GHVQ01007534.1:191-1246(+)